VSVETGYVAEYLTIIVNRYCFNKENFVHKKVFEK